MRFDGKRLAALRTARKMGQHELAQAARQHGSGVTQSGVSKHENGKQPSARNVMAYALALGIQPSDLFEIDDSDKAMARDDSDDEDSAVADLVKALEGFVDARRAKAVRVGKAVKA